jgi:hypothetical protein
VHSRYERRLLDTAAGGCEVVVCLAVRRFLCLAADCAKVTFAEQVDGLTSRHARCTPAVTAVLEAVALALGGRAGARLSGRLAAQVSRMTLLRLVRAPPDPALSASPRVLGVDFAMRELTPGQSDDLYELIGRTNRRITDPDLEQGPAKSAHVHGNMCKAAAEGSRVRLGRAVQRVAVNAWPVRTGTTRHELISVAMATSSANPVPVSSLPETEFVTADARSAVASKQARASSASGDRRLLPCSFMAAMTAPAPSRSSSAGRRLPSGQRSPAAITVTGCCGVPKSCSASHRPTAFTLRRHAAVTVAPPSDAAAEIADPFGEGSTSLAVKGARRSAAGDSDHGESADAVRSPAASCA